MEEDVDEEVRSAAGTHREQAGMKAARKFWGGVRKCVRRTEVWKVVLDINDCSSVLMAHNDDMRFHTCRRRA